MSDDQQQQTSSDALSEVLRHWTKCCLEEDSVQSPEELQEESRTFCKYLSQSTKIVTDGNVQLETKSSHEAALARIIQDLGPAFSGEHHESRLRALHVLVGAIEGCQQTPFSNTITKLLGTFLLSHCGPIDDDGYEEDYDSMIRNVAIVGLTALAQTSSLANSDPDILEAFLMRLQFVRQGVVSRCAVPKSMKDSNDHYSYGLDSTTDMREQLSTLPRSKRALCFSLVGSGFAGIAAITDQMEKPLDDASRVNLQAELVEFARFASSCLHGESDPRCLLQLLTILHQMQISLEPYFLSTGSPDLVFPSEDLFDAVAPYYPVQFTPPPNNIHRITREGLHEALVSVLCYTNMDANAQTHSRHTMLGLSSGLFIEQLVPMEGEEPSSTLDKLEAVECLSDLLFPRDNESVCSMLDIPTLRNLWAAIKMTHDESSIGISLGGIQGENNKLLADQCRTLVSKLAFQLETASNKSLWEAFISEPILKQSQKVKQSPANTKLTIAYMACLTASGGPRTLRFCLGVGLDLLLDYLAENLSDTEDVTAAAHGIGAFFSSCQVALDRGKREGVVLHPHPLEPYAAKACQILLDAFEHESLSMSTKIGATRALQFLVLSVSKDQLEENHIERLCSFIERLFESIDAASSDMIEWNDTCCSTLGLIVGNSLLPDATSGSSGLLSCQNIRKLIKGQIFPKLQNLTTISTESTVSERYDRKALSISCACNEDISVQVIGSLLQHLSDNLGSYPIDDSCMGYCACLSYLLGNGGNLVLKAYHGNPLSSRILKILSEGVPSSSNKRASVSKLALPSTSEEAAYKYAQIQAVVVHLLPAYERKVPDGTLVAIAKAVSDIIPPLSEADNIHLYIHLPILGAALASFQRDDFVDDNAMQTDEASLQEICRTMLPGLTQYVLTNEHHSKARSAAASCIFAIFSHGIIDAEECPIMPLVQDVVNKGLTSSADHVTLSNHLNLLSLLASAAARRGLSSSNTAAEISQFFVDLAWSSSALLPFSSANEIRLDLSLFDDSRITSALEITAASLYGSILSTDAKPLMKQRLMQPCLKYVKLVYENERNQATPGNSSSTPKVGLLVMVCHVVCVLDISKMDKKSLHQMASIAVEGLSASQLFDPSTPYSPKNTSSKNLILVAILKVLSVAPWAVPAKGFLLTLATGLLQAYAVSDPALEVSTKLLALQGLEAMTHVEEAKKSIATIQPAVVSVLAAAVNHPSGLLRQAAVDVRNAWYLVE
eukprot:scaffold953_cov141-Cylindrotheca_fusiformis.AAC.2